MKPDNSKWIVLTIVAAVIGAFLGPMLGRSLSGGAVSLIFGVFFIAVIGFVIWSLSANKVGKKAPATILADARTMKAAAGTARIYVVRRGFMGGAAGMKVIIDGVASGQIRMNQFVMAEVPPGTYTIETVMARNGVKPSNSTSTLTLQSGEVAVILAMLQMEAMHARTTQQRVLGSEAQAEIARAKMILWTDQPGGSVR
jgi:uncharacterized membrane protein YeaQ/YmgE (transglycosylase-associated protein family)